MLQSFQKLHSSRCDVVRLVAGSSQAGDGVNAAAEEAERRRPGRARRCLVERRRVSDALPARR
jgi:hypothetical protein